MLVADESDLEDQEYADDTLLFLLYTPGVLDMIRCTLEIFYVANGARINWDKSYGILAGSDDVPTWVLLSGEVMPGVTTVEIASRRKKLMSALPHGSLVILIAATVKHMTDVVPYPFRQSSHYLYFTGCREPGSIAVIYNAGDLCMFMPDPNPENALWEGRLAHAAEAMTNLKANRAYNMSDLPKFLPRLLKQAKAIYAEDENCPGDDLGKLPAYKELVQEKKVLSVHKYAYECRFVKSPSEISLMRRAAKITSEAFIQTMKVSRTRAHEHILAATMDFECKFRGAQRLA
ncbi:hypothetical protein L7F22_062796 [Adiantum nelumboides]|nr:hypothetical protein [Adiantum nelumboides]